MGFGIKKTVEETEPGKLSQHQVKRVVRISAQDGERANRVLDRMKKRKGITSETSIEGGGIRTKFTPEQQQKSMGTGGLRAGARPLATGTSEFKQVDLKSESKPLATGSSGFKYVELKKPELSKEDIEKVGNIRNPNRAKRVLENMKKEKGISTTKIL
jgi:hypothetical protein